MTLDLFSHYCSTNPQFHEQKQTMGHPSVTFSILPGMCSSLFHRQLNVDATIK